MEIIATIPPPHMAAKVQNISNHPYVDAVRFNTGARSSAPPLETLEQLLELSRGKKFWLDLKGRQLRISKWAVPTYGDIILNHKVSVDLPAQLVFRDGVQTTIVAIDGRKLFVDPPPPDAVGDGQAVNIRGDNLIIDGYLTQSDRAYINAARKLGINNIMLSFVEELSDVTSILNILPEAKIVLKIESEKGVDFVRKLDTLPENYNLMAARDDLFVNLDDRKTVYDATKQFISKDQRSIAASRILTSLVDQSMPSIGDLADLKILYDQGYRRFMLNDSLCFNSDAFERAMDWLVSTKGGEAL